MAVSVSCDAESILSTIYQSVHVPELSNRLIAFFQVEESIDGAPENVAVVPLTVAVPVVIADAMMVGVSSNTAWGTNLVM